MSPSPCLFQVHFSSSALALTAGHWSLFETLAYPLSGPPLGFFFALISPKQFRYPLLGYAIGILCPVTFFIFNETFNSFLSISRPPPSSYNTRLLRESCLSTFAVSRVCHPVPYPNNPPFPWNGFDPFGEIFDDFILSPPFCMGPLRHLSPDPSRPGEQSSAFFFQ